MKMSGKKSELSTKFKGGLIYIKRLKQLRISENDRIKMIDLETQYAEILKRKENVYSKMSRESINLGHLQKFDNNQIKFGKLLGK